MEKKFRVWDGSEYLFNAVILFETNEIIETHPLAGFRIRKVEAVELFTGLQDMTGADIYEGDLMTHPDFKVHDVGPVTFLKGCFLLSGWDCVRTDFSKGKIVGTIHDPPLVQLPTEPTEWFPLGAELTSLENGKLIVAPKGTPRDLIVGVVTLNGLETK